MRSGLRVMVRVRVTPRASHRVRVRATQRAALRRRPRPCALRGHVAHGGPEAMPLMKVMQVMQLMRVMKVMKSMKPGRS